MNPVFIMFFFKVRNSTASRQYIFNISNSAHKDLSRSLINSSTHLIKGGFFSVLKKV